MAHTAPGHRIAVVAGGGMLPLLVTAALVRRGYSPVVFAIEGEADAKLCGLAPAHVIRWGEIGRFFRLAREASCREALFIGTISRRPNFNAIRPDLGGLKFIPRILQLMRGGDDSLLVGVAGLLQEQGMLVVGPLDVAPELRLPMGCLIGSGVSDAMEDIHKAARAARRIGRLDVGQAAVAVGGEVVAVEDASGTDALLARVAAMRLEGLISAAGGVLVKCMKPQQDPRLDVPTIGPVTAQHARRAGLYGVAGEAGRTLLAGRDETVEAFRRAGLFLFGLTPLEPR